MVWRLTCTRRARSEAPTPLLFRIWPSRFSTRVLTMAISSTERLRAWPTSEPSVRRFVLRHNQPEAALRAEQRLAIRSVRQQNPIVDKSRIEFAERENYLIPVLRSQKASCKSIQNQRASCIHDYLTL